MLKPGSQDSIPVSIWVAGTGLPELSPSASLVGINKKLELVPEPLLIPKYSDAVQKSLALLKII